MIDVTDDVLIKIDTRHLLVEQFVEHGAEKNLSTVFHSTIKGIVDTTVEGCSFLKKAEPKSLEDIIAILVSGHVFLKPKQVELLTDRFTFSVGDKLDRFIEQFREAHPESFVQSEIVKLLIKNGWATDDQLFRHLELHKALSSQTQRSLELRKENIEMAAALLRQAPSVANLPVIKAIERFYNDMFAIENEIFHEGIRAIAELRSYLDNLSS